MKRTLLAAVPAGWAAVLLAIGFWPLAAQVRGSEGEARVRPHRARGDAPDFPDLGSRLGGPVLGLLFDREAGALRPILGVPGAASVGPPLDAGAVLTLAAVAADQWSAVAVAGEDSKVIVIRLRDWFPETNPVEGATPGPDRIVTSASGSVAALYYPEGRIEILRGLPEAPVVAGGMELAGLGGELTALAVDDNGQTALAAITEENSGAVYLLAPNRAPQLLLRVRAPAVAFVPETRDALVADGPESRIYVIRDVSGGAGIAVLASAEQGIASPAAIAVAGRKAVVANLGSRALVTVDLDSGSAASIGCECEPSRLERLAGLAVFRLTDAGPGPIWIFDGDAAEARALFVPAPARTDVGEQQ